LTAFHQGFVFDFAAFADGNFGGACVGDAAFFAIDVGVGEGRACGVE
jgi:hypothetical protein